MSRSTDEQTEPKTRDMEELVMLAAHSASDKKATDIIVLDLRQIASFTEFFLICTGANARQAQAISDSVEEQLRKEGKRPLHIEGYSGAEWILLDYGDFIVHVFSQTARRFYDLERLWRDAGRIEVKEQADDEGAKARPENEKTEG